MKYMSLYYNDIFYYLIDSNINPYHVISIKTYFVKIFI